MWARVANLVARWGDDPDDTLEIRVQKRVLVTVSAVVGIIGALWGALYLAFDEPLAAAIPWTYALGVGASLFGFALTGPWGYLSGAGNSFGPLEVGPLSSLAYLGLGGLLVRASYRERNQLQRALSVTMAALVGLILIDLSGTRLAELLAVNGPDAVLHGALAVATVTVGISVRRAG